MAKKAVTWRVGEGLLAALKDEAKLRGCSQADLVERLCEQGLQKVPLDAQPRDVQARMVPARSEPPPRAEDLMWERQVRLNKKMGWDS